MKSNLLNAVALSLVVVALLALNVTVAYGHDWWYWCWHTGRTIDVYVFGSNQTEARAALNDWDSHTDVNFNYVSSHTQMSVKGDNYGATGWWGLATVDDASWDSSDRASYDWWHHFRTCEIEHAHAVYNSYYGGTSDDIQGVFCQEIGHTLGLDHSDNGCMGKGYYDVMYPDRTVQHNWDDINAKF